MAYSEVSKKATYKNIGISLKSSVSVFPKEKNRELLITPPPEVNRSISFLIALLKKL